MSHPNRRWLITGCSTGFGRALAQILIARGETVFATARKLEQISDLVAGHPNAHALKLDVTDAVDSEKPPLNLILGAFGVKAVRDKIAALSAEIDAWEQVSLGADFPQDA